MRKAVDLDIDAYSQYLYDQGLDSSQIKSITIHFTVAGRFLSAGVYNFKTHKMQISVPRSRNINRLLVHETHHAIEGMLGRISNIDRFINCLFNVGVYTGTAILVLAAAWSLLNDALRISQLYSFLHCAFGFGAALFLVGGVAYIANPAERRAYAAKVPSVRFVKVVKRPFREQFIGLGQMAIARMRRRS